MHFSLRTLLFVVSWCALTVAAISALLSLPSEYADLPVGVMFLFVFCLALYAIIRAIVASSIGQRFWMGFAVVCIGCGLVAHSEPLTRINALPAYAADLLIERRDAVEQPVRRNEVHQALKNVAGLSVVPLLALLGGLVAQAAATHPSHKKGVNA